ncbi:MAG TPA: flippase [Nevskiaceae bacterium]|nr:flippase [Nevskiaceae bacterium]
MSLSQKVAFNTVVQIVSKVITVFFTLLTTVLLTSYLGKGGFGDYIYVITLVIMFGALADWGTATIGVREAAKKVEKQGQIFANILVLRLLLSFLATVLLIGFAYFVPLKVTRPETLRQAIMVASILLILNVLKASFGIVFQVKLQMQKLALTNIVTSGLIFLISCFFVKAGFGLLSLMIAYLLATGFGVLIAGFLASKTVKFVFVFDKKILTRLIKESLPMGAILLMFTIDNKIDTVMLGAIKGSESVGIYGIAYRIYDVLILGSAFLMNALLPIISQYADLKKWQTKLQQIYQKSFDVLLLMGIGVVGLVWWLAPLMVQTLTQKRFVEFADAVWVLRILSLAMLIAYFNHLAGYTIVALGKQRPYFFVALIALIFNVFANLFVIPRFSYFGAATVTILTEALVFLITTFFIFKLLKIIPSFISFPKTVLQLIKQKGKLL